MTSVAKAFSIPEVKKIDYQHVPWLLPEQNIGIEVEIDTPNSNRGRRNVYPSLEMWEVTSDGSLLNGKEYILRRPMSGLDLSRAVSEFFAQDAFSLYRMPTSGTHIHLDMREATTTFALVRNLTLLVSIIEPAIFEMFAEGREHSGYTNPIETIPNKALNAVFRDNLDEDYNDFVQVFSSGKTYKYYGLNLMPLSRYGSIEFRYFPTCVNKEELIEWIQFVMAVKRAAVSITENSSLKLMLDNTDNYDQMIRTFFDPWYSAIINTVDHKRARRRYKKFRLAAKNYTVQAKPPTTSALAESKKFRKFFAKRKLNPVTNKYEVTYGLPPAPDCFIRLDGSVANTQEHQWLWTGEILYYKDEHHFRRVITYSEYNNRIVVDRVHGSRYITQENIDGLRAFLEHVASCNFNMPEIFIGPSSVIRNRCVNLSYAINHMAVWLNGQSSHPTNDRDQSERFYVSLTPPTVRNTDSEEL